MRATKTYFLTATVLVLGLGSMEASAHDNPVKATAHTARATDMSAQARRPRVRIYRAFDERGVYPSYFPGSNAVRDCNVAYVQEFRPSGTVIVPNMKCFWRQP